MANEPLAPADVVTCYHGRGEAKNLIKEFKNGAGTGHLPCATLAANLARIWFCALTYNFHVALRERLFHGQRLRAQTVRWRRLMAGRVGRTGRQWPLRLAEQNRRQLQRWRAAIAAARAMPPVTSGRRRWQVAVPGILAA